MPVQDKFAGAFLFKHLPQSYLIFCKNCKLQMRHPIISVSEYNQLYQNSETNVWSNPKNELRPDQLLIRSKLLKKYPVGCEILEVGCFTGNLLEALPENFIKYGIELSEKASQAAGEKGIKMLGTDFYEISGHQKFKVILAIDVIEHTPNPAQFLNQLFSRLTVDGEIIISTGNADFWLWKLLKHQFWYSSFPEHISFIGDAWLAKYCHEQSLIVTDKEYFNHMHTNLRTDIKNVIKIILALMRIQPIRFSYALKDHMVVSLSNNNNKSEK